MNPVSRLRRDRLFSAELHASLGIPVFPLKVDAKEPATRRGFRDATTNLRQIRRWWGEEPQANVGGAACDGRTAVVDVDARDGKRGLENLQKLETAFGPLPNTRVTLTVNGGRHYWFKTEERLRHGKDVLGYGIDVISNGYAVLPGSKIGAREYALASAYPLAQVPGWVLDVASEPEPESSKALGLGRELTNRLELGSGFAEATSSNVAISPVLGLGSRAPLYSKWTSELAQWDRDPALLQLLTWLPTSKLEESFQCPLHPDRRHKARLFAGATNGAILFRCFGRRRDSGSGRTMTLTELYARLRGWWPELNRDGVAKPLAKVENSVYQRRLLVEARILAPAEVPDPLPYDDLDEFTRQIYLSLFDIQRVRWTREPGEPAPFTKRFVSKWNATRNVPKVDESLGILKRGERYLLRAGEAPAVFGKNMTLWHLATAEELARAA